MEAVGAVRQFQGQTWLFDYFHSKKNIHTTSRMAAALSLDSAHNIYLPLTISNSSTATQPVLAKLSQQISEPFLERADDYKCTIVRFSLPINALPYFSSSAATYKVALSWRGTSYQQTLSVASYSSLAGSSSSVFYIAQFVSALNVALAASYAAVIAANTGDAQLYAGHAPYVVFNSTTDLLSLIVDAGVWNTGTATFLPLIYLNTPLSVLLSGLPQYEASINSVGGLDDYIVIDPNNLGNDSTQLAAQFFVTSNQTYTKSTIPLIPLRCNYFYEQMRAVKQR